MFAALAMTAMTACTTYHDQLGRGQRSFELAEHDRTLAILRDLEPDLKRLPMPEQAQYAYMRGITDYRVGYKPDARHWLSVAKAYEDHSPGVLPADWKARINETLDELNGVVYTGGTGALITARTEGPDSKDAKDSKDGDRDRREAKEPHHRRDTKEAKKDSPPDAAKDPTDPPAAKSAEPGTK
jgi:hypothetical protein